MILIISIKSSQSPQNAGIFHSQYPCLRTCGITPSNSRPRVSNDNPYAESLFKTLKYHPNYQPKGFETLEEAREWVSLFVKWYNHDHHHSGLNFLTPYRRRSGSSDCYFEKWAKQRFRGCAKFRESKGARD